MYLLYDISNECFMPVFPNMDGYNECFFEEVEPGIFLDFAHVIRNGSIETLEED